MITLTLVFVVLAAVLAWRSKSPMLAIVCIIAGLYLAGTDFGHTITDTLNNISHGADGWMHSGH